MVEASNMNMERATAQFSTDARLTKDTENFDESGKYFNYSDSINYAPNSMIPKNKRVLIYQAFRSSPNQHPNLLHFTPILHQTKNH